MTDVQSAEPLSLRLYRAVSAAAGPLAEYALRRRIASGKEDPHRVDERRGVAGISRPEADLVWIHGASVGESLSVIPLVERLKASLPNAKFLVTTGTTTSAQLMAKRLPQEAFHQYVPIDHPRYVAAFLEHWRPKAGLFVESEFWPNLLFEARRRVPFLALVNGRVSPRSFEEWMRRRQAIEYVLSLFDVILAQDKDNATRLSKLAQRRVTTMGNLKYAAPALPTNAQELAVLREAAHGRPVWLAASTHPGEDCAIFDAQLALRKIVPNVLLLIAPRHPARGAELAALAQERGLSPRRRSMHEKISDDCNVYIADTLGELGLLYSLSEISFIGGSLIEKGGHNPLEPARLGNAVLHGPHTFNFIDIYAEMRGGGGSALVRNDREIAVAVQRLLSDTMTRNVMVNAARNCAESRADRILGEVSAVLLNHLAAPVAR